MSKILLISSSLPLHRRMHELCIREGIDLLPAKTAEDGIVAARRLKPELALIDVCMPEKSGLEIAKEIITGETEVRIIMISDINTSSVRAAAIRSGARDLLIKPVSDTELLFTLKLYMEDLNESAS